MREFVQETEAQLVRWVIHLRREPFNLTFSLVQPVIVLIFFGGAFGRVAAGAVPGGDYRTYLLAGVLALTVFGNSMGGGIPLLFDKENGFLTRLLAAPISRTSILVGRFLAINLISIIQCGIILGLAFTFGVRVATGVPGVAALLGIGLLLGFGVTVVSLVLAFVLENHGDFFGLLGLVTLPLTFLSSAFIPLATMPDWMGLPARVNPMTYAVDGMRALILTGWDVPYLARMAAVLVAFDLLMLGVGIGVLRRRIA